MLTVNIGYLEKPMLTYVLMLTVNISYLKKPMLRYVLMLIVNIGYLKKPMLTYINIGFLTDNHIGVKSYPCGMKVSCKSGFFLFLDTFFYVFLGSLES